MTCDHISLLPTCLPRVRSPCEKKLEELRPHPLVQEEPSGPLYALWTALMGSIGYVIGGVMVAVAVWNRVWEPTEHNGAPPVGRGRRTGGGDEQGRRDGGRGSRQSRKGKRDRRR